MNEPIGQSGSSVSSSIAGERGKVRAAKGPETVINPERRQPSPTTATGSGKAEDRLPATGGGLMSRSSIVRMLFPAEEGDDSQPFEVRPGLELGHFSIIERIRTGGMGAVFRALDTRLNRVVALKVLPPLLSRDPTIVQRFKNEGQAAAQLDHENVARVYFIGEEHGLHYIAFEFVNGANVRDLIASQRQLGIEDSLNYALQIASALVHTSAQGVIHRDIKPSNIIITPTGRAKLVDLGLARKEQKEDQAIDLTMAGTTLGTFDYISPEQARDPRSADIRSDIYSLGCTLYHMLTGEPPYPEGTVLQKLLQHQGDDAPDPAAKNRKVPQNLSVVIRKMMAKDPRRRYQSADTLVRDLMLVAGELGLQSISPEGLVWQSTTAVRQSFLARHSAWIATAALLLVITGYLEFGPSIFSSPADRQARGDKLIDQRGNTGTPKGSDGGESAVTVAGNEGAIKASASETSGTESIDSNTSRNAAKSSIAAEKADEPRSPLTDDEVPGRPFVDLIPMPLVSEIRRDDGDFPYSFALSRPKELDEPWRTGDAEKGLTGKTSKGSEQVVSPEKSREAASTNSATTLETGAGDRNGSSNANPLANADEEGIFVLGRDSNAARRFSTLELACASVRENGATIELRFNGKRRESVLRINRKITIRAANGYHPIVEFRPASTTIEDYKATAVWIPSGSLDLVGVDFVFVVEDSTLAENWVLFSIERPDAVRMEQTTVTIVNPSARPTSVFEFRTPAGAAMPDMPAVGTPPRSPLKVEIADSFIRGGADLFAVGNAEPARLSIDKSLIALQGNLLTERTSTDVQRENTQLELRLDYVTCVSAGGLIRLVGGNMPRKLLPLHLFASNCIFSNASAAPLIEMSGNAPSQDFRELLSWEGQNNFYDRYVTFWSIAAMDEAGSRSEPWDAAAWQRWTSSAETNPHFGAVVWTKRGWMTRPFGELVPNDFTLDRQAPNNPPVRGSANFKDAGAEIESIRPPTAGL